MGKFFIIKFLFVGCTKKEFCGRDTDFRYTLFLVPLSLNGLYLISSYNVCIDRKSTRLNSSHSDRSRMPSSA